MLKITILRMCTALMESKLFTLKIKIILYLLSKKAHIFLNLFLLHMILIFETSFHII
jgi:hypothetical protein